MALKDLIRDVHGPKTIRLSPAIDKYLVHNETLPNDHDFGWHPSSFCDSCPRAQVISDVLGLELGEGSIAPKLRRIFDVGSACHRWYQEEYLGPMGILWGKWRCSRCHGTTWGFMPKNRHGCERSLEDTTCWKLCGGEEGRLDQAKIAKRGGCIHCGVWGRWEFKEIPFRLEHPELEEPVLSHTDGLLWLAQTWITLEVKTINSFGFAALNDAKLQHVLQGQCYSELLMRKAVRGLPPDVEVPEPEKLLVFYIGKNTSDEREFLMDVDREVGSAVLEKPLIVERSMETRELPPRHEECEGKPLTKRAKKCKAKKYCFAANVSFANLVKYRSNHGRRTK